ncbi:MAG TPA: hypothetical protein VE981_14775 [Planctomycetota bacterium]|nr:hypothetical protein [Planctomycetota bacterium]
MRAHRLCSILAVIALNSACSSPGSSPPPRAGSGDARDGLDSVRLVNGEVVKGRILEDTGRQVILERETVVSTYPRAAIFSIDWSKERWQERRAPLQSTEAPVEASRPATTWLPRTDPRDPVQQTEVLFHDTHAFAECLGPSLAKALQDLPDLRLFVEPGGRIVLHDPKQWGYHAHLPGGVLRVPAGKPGLSIDLGRDEAALPESISFVSPAQEIKAGDSDARSSYALPDAVTAVVKPVSAAEPLLSVQPFAGGKPLTTANGALWAFTLPRNSRQFFVYLFDASRRHAEILKAAYVGFGETVLAADLMIDLVGADGLTLGRVLVVPFPDRVSADGPAHEPLTVYAGPIKDPTPVAALTLPPREAIQLPSRASSVKADVLVSHYEVSASIPQGVVVAHGLGRPTKDVTLVARELTPKDPDLIVKIDVSSLPEERFPAVAWLYQRRTYAWKTTGGYLPPIPPAAAPPSREPRLAKLRRSDAIPHVIPLLFTGPKPQAAVARGVDPAAQIAGGMASGLLRDALVHENGMGTLTQNIGAAPAAVPSDPGAISNVTYVYITSPPHTPGVDAPAGGGGNGIDPSIYGFHYNGWGTGSRMSAAPGSPGTGPGGFVMQSQPDSGGVNYNPQTGATSGGGMSPLLDVGGVAVPLRRTRR